MTCVCNSLWSRISEAFSVKLSEKYRQNLVVHEVYIGIGLKKSYRSSSSYLLHTVAHLCNQFIYVFAVLISTPRFKSNNIYQTRPKIKLLQKYCKIFKHWGLRPQTPNGFRRLGVLPPYQKAQPSCCKFLALHMVRESVLRMQMQFIKIFHQSQERKSRCMKE